MASVDSIANTSRVHFLGIDDGTTLVATVFGRVTDNLDEAAATVGAENFVGNDGEGHGIIVARSENAEPHYPPTRKSAIAATTK